AASSLFAAMPLAAQEPGDSAPVDVGEIFVGQRATLELTVTAPAGATVEVDPGADSWNGVEVVSITPRPEQPGAGASVYGFRVIVASFLPGESSFEPSVTIITDDGASVRTLPPVTWN